MQPGQSISVCASGVGSPAELASHEASDPVHNYIPTALTSVAESRQREAASQSGAEEQYSTLFDTAPVGMALSDHQGALVACNRNLCAMLRVSREEARALGARAFYAQPADRRRLLAQVRKNGKVEQAGVLLRRRDGSTFLALLHMEQVRLGQRRAVLTVVLDITQQKQNEWRVEGVRELLELFATQSTRRGYVKAVVRFLRDWSGCRCAGIRLLERSGRIPYADSVGYSRDFLKLENCLSLDMADCPCTRIFLGRPMPGDASFTSSRGSFFCNHASRVARDFSADAAQRTQLACLRAGYDSIAHAPIRYHGKLLGTIHLADRREHRFPPETVSFIETVAPLIGEALHRFQVEESLSESEKRFRSLFERHAAPMLLVEPESGAIEGANPAAAAFYGHSREQLQSMRIEGLAALPPQPGRPRLRPNYRNGHACQTVPHRLASGETRIVEVYSSPVRVNGRQLLFSIIHDVTERKLLEKQILDVGEVERQRIGQDLHDSLGGMLTGLALLSKALARRLAESGVPEAGAADEIAHAINDAVSRTRTIARGLFPAELKTLGLVAGLREFAAETARRTHVSCQVRAGKDLAIRDDSAAAHLFRIAQEAVTNAIRHGKARHVTIRLTRPRGQLLLEVRDDGKGMPPPSETGEGLGLRTMKFRADAIGAHFSVASDTGRGTVIACLLPPRNAAMVNRA